MLPFRAAVLLFLVAWTPAARSQSAPDLYDDRTLRTLDLTFHQQDWWSQLHANRASETYLRADLRVGNETLRDVGVRFRGGTSYRDGAATGKYPFRISMDAFVPDQRLWDRRGTVLNNGHYDPTFCREPLAYLLYRDLLPASRANFVRLVINQQYWGLYVNVEPTNKDFLRSWYRDDDGHRYKGARQLSPYAYLPATHPLVSKSSPQAYQDLVAVTQAMISNDVSGQLPLVFDVQQALRYMAAANVVSDIDGLFRLNYYLYSDPWHGRISALPWDLNFTFIQSAPVPLAHYLPVLRRPEWDPYVLAYARSTCEARLDWSELGPIVNRWRTLIDAAVRADTKSLYGYAAFQSNLKQPVQLGLVSVPGLESWVRQQRVSLLAAIPAGPDLASAARAPEVPDAKDEVALTVRSKSADDVFVHWRSRGAWARALLFDDGKHGDGAPGDGVWGGKLPAQKPGTEIEYWFEANDRARRSAGAVSFLPRSGSHRPYRYRVRPDRSGVLLNEFLAKNESGVRDEKGEREDWIELINPTASPIVLDGMHLTDNVHRPRKWSFPSNTVLAPGKTLLLWADDEPGDGPLHTTFKLDGDGEELALFAPDGKTMLDYFTFGRQYDDVSTGRLHDRDSVWVSYAVPSPDAANAGGACGVRLYSALSSARHGLGLTVSGSPKIGTSPTLRLAQGAPAAPFLLLLGGQGGHVYLPGTPLALLLGDPIFWLASIQGDAQGAASVPLALPPDARLVGLRIYVQAFGVQGSALAASNAFEMAICR